MTDGGFSVQAASAPRHISAFGIGAVICGGLAFILCWIPIINAITVPLSFVGLLLSLIGVVLSFVRKDTGLGLPIAGIAINGVALATAVLILAAFVTAVEKTQEVRDAINQEKRARIERSLSESGGKRSEEDVTESKPEWSRGLVRLDDVEVAIKEAKFEKVKLTGIRGESRSEEPELILILSVKNAGQTRKMDFRTWRGSGIMIGDDSGSLEDDFGNRYKRITFGYSAQIEGARNISSIYPANETTDILVFEPPVKKATELRLSLPAGNFGGEGIIQISLPVSEVQGL